MRKQRRRTAKLISAFVFNSYFDITIPLLLKLNLELESPSSVAAQSDLYRTLPETQNVGFLMTSLSWAPRYSLFLGVKRQLILTRGMPGIDQKPTSILVNFNSLLLKKTTDRYTIIIAYLQVAYRKCQQQWIKNIYYEISSLTSTPLSAAVGSESDR